MKILDVGCGDAKIQRDGADVIGVDCVQLPGVDVVHDLNKYPWPFENDSFDEIHMKEIIEHLPNTIKVMEEIHRILKPSGSVHIRVIYWNHRHSISDPQHVSFFNEVTWEFFTGKRKGYYTKVQFSMERFEFTYDKKARRIFRSEKLMRFLSYFLCNVIDGMRLTLVK
ncbi:methyltransferase domain-containing protein [Spirochaetota bacterium]